ncbi:type II toxin-antitoxin system VapB family antitoxin [Methylorubrum sp. SB2]|uniref:type II toxin-antitoxin system VapB family antitoxin n=1 Tax=Methylorubrum subtropicum TaxID=3138812 RepID=UPI00313AC36E
MSLTIDDDEIDRLAERLASVARVDKEEAVRMALANELQRREGSLADRIKPIQDAFAAWPQTGLKADKAFFDEMNGEPRCSSMRPRWSPSSRGSPDREPCSMPLRTLRFASRRPSLFSKR